MIMFGLAFETVFSASNSFVLKS